MRRLSENMRTVLWLAVQEGDVLAGCTGTRDRGARMNTVYALRRRGFLHENTLTHDGRTVIGAFRYCDKCGLGEGEHMACEEPDCGRLILTHQKPE